MTQARTAFVAPVKQLNRDYTVELFDMKSHALVIGPLGIAPATVKAKSSCASKSDAPCIQQSIKATDPVNGFASGSDYQVEITVGTPTGTTSKGCAPIQADGSFSLDVSSLKEGDTITMTQTPLASMQPCGSGGAATVGGGANPAAPSQTTADKSAAQNPSTTTAKVVTATSAASSVSGTTSSLYALGLVGINATGSSNAGPSQQYLASFDVMGPLPFLGSRVCTPFDSPHRLRHKCWIWLNPRIASAPSAANTSLTSYSSTSSLTSGISGQTVGQISQTFELQAGMEYSLRDPYWGTQFGSGNSWARISTSFILGGGTYTPLNPQSNASEYDLNTNLGAQFNNNPTFANLYPTLAQALCNTTWGYNPTGGCTNPTPATVYKHVAFVLPGRSRFYRDCYGGIRLRTYFF